MPRKRVHPTTVMNTEQAATYVGVSESLLEKLRATDRGPPFATIGGLTIRYRIRDLDEWLASLVHRSIAHRRRTRGDTGKH